MSRDDPYLYPGTFVLKNKLGIVNAAELASVERLLVTQRTTEGPPQGRFDLDHLKAITGICSKMFMTGQARSALSN